VVKLFWAAELDRKEGLHAKAQRGMGSARRGDDAGRNFFDDLRIELVLGFLNAGVE
jgi:hypothetical protein